MGRSASTLTADGAIRLRTLLGSGRRPAAGARSTAVADTTERSSAQRRMSAGTKRTVPPIFRNGMQCAYCHERIVLVETERNLAASWAFQRGSSSMATTLFKEAVNFRGGDSPLPVKLHRSDFTTVNPCADSLRSYGQDVRQFLCGEVSSPWHKSSASRYPLSSCQGFKHRLFDLDVTAATCRWRARQAQGAPVPTGSELGRAWS